MELTERWVELGENFVSMMPVAALPQFINGYLTKPVVLLFLLYDHTDTR